MAQLIKQATITTKRSCLRHEPRSRLHAGNACCSSVQNLLYSCWPCKDMQNYNFACCVVWAWIWSVTLREQHRLIKSKGIQYGGGGGGGGASGGEEKYVLDFVGRLRKRDRFNHQGVGGGIILKCIFKKWDWRAWTGFVCFVKCG